jgi:hypothetical protein
MSSAILWKRHGPTIVSVEHPPHSRLTCDKPSSKVCRPQRRKWKFDDRQTIHSQKDVSSLAAVSIAVCSCASWMLRRVVDSWRLDKNNLARELSTWRSGGSKNMVIDFLRKHNLRSSQIYARKQLAWQFIHNWCSSERSCWLQRIRIASMLAQSDILTSFWRSICQRTDFYALNSKWQYNRCVTR